MAATSQGLIPQAFWFRLSLPCRRIDGLPRTEDRGRLLDLPASCALPPLARLEGREPWSEVRVAWNPGGLAVAVEVSGKLRPVQAPDPDDLTPPDGVGIWIDTRDTRNVHRATKFCHRFAVAVVPARGKGGGLEAKVAQKSIHRALGDAPRAPEGAVSTRAETTKTGWRLELFFPAEALHGFDPETNRRLGLMVQATDPDRGDEFLLLSREFPVGEDPSLWATIELRDEG